MLFSRSKTSQSNKLINSRKNETICIKKLKQLSTDKVIQNDTELFVHIFRCKFEQLIWPSCAKERSNYSPIFHSINLYLQRYGSFQHNGAIQTTGYNHCLSDYDDKSNIRLWYPNTRATDARHGL